MKISWRQGRWRKFPSFDATASYATPIILQHSSLCASSAYIIPRCEKSSTKRAATETLRSTWSRSSVASRPALLTDRTVWVSAGRL